MFDVKMCEDSHSHISAVLLLCSMFSRDFTSCCASANRSSWTAG